MASHSASQKAATASDIEKVPTSLAETNNQAEGGVNEKSEPTGETLPGWTIMRPLKMRGLKGKGKGHAALASNASNVSRNGNGVNNIDGKNNDELKVTATNDTGDGPGGIGEVEALHEVRSDDELLGPEDDGPSPQRVTADHGLENGRDQANGNSSGGNVYKVYKRRWFGLVQLVLLNIIVSWDVSIPFERFSQPHQIVLTRNSGFRFQQIRRLLHNTIMCHRRLSIGSAQRFCLHLWLLPQSSSTLCTMEVQNLQLS